MRLLLLWLLTALAAAAPAGAAPIENVLYNFDSPRTGFPDGNLLRDRSGALLGTGSGYANAAPYGQVFMLRPSGNSWKLKRLLAFDGPHGSTPLGGLIVAPGGIYYGTTSRGGAYGGGTVFQLVHSGGAWVETVLQSFQTGTDEMVPYGRLAIHKGALYGTDVGGKGAVFQLKAEGNQWDQSVLHSFGGGAGRKPISGLTRDPKTGVFYGTALSGGSSGCGTVFALAPLSGRWKIETLHDFSCGSDGARPESGLAEDSSGALYGTTSAGGNTTCGYNAGGCGLLFRLTEGSSGWQYTILHTFSGGDGAYPQNHDGLAVDSSGTIYGTASQGGAEGRGVVFKFSTSGNGYTLLHSFGGAADGEYPSGGVIEDEKSGTLYGTTYAGGAFGYGTIYRIAQ